MGLLLDFAVKFGVIIFKNVRRNMLRPILTSLGTMVLVLVITLIWSVLHFLDRAMADKATNFKVIVTERWQIPSRMPFAYAASLSKAAASKPDDMHPKDWCTWQFYGGTLDPKNRTRENSLFFICMQPQKIPPMAAELENPAGAPQARPPQLLNK